MASIEPADAIMRSDGEYAMARILTSTLDVHSTYFSTAHGAEHIRRIRKDGRVYMHKQDAINFRNDILQREQEDRDFCILCDYFLDYLVENKIFDGYKKVFNTGCGRGGISDAGIIRRKAGAKLIVKYRAHLKDFEKEFYGD